MKVDSQRELQTHFHQRDAIQLAYALTAHRAQKLEIRALAVKGLVSDFHGLRPPRIPADIDILVEPLGFDALIAALAEDGWEPRPRGEVVGRDSHSITLINSTWPCDIDVHEFVPGFLNEPAAVFDQLWDARVVLNFANRACPSAGFNSSLLIQALHSLRSPEENPRHAMELANLLDRFSGKLLPHEQSALLDHAASTGAAYALGGLLDPLGIPSYSLEDVPEHLHEEVLLWVRQNRNDASSGLYWAHSLSQASWHKRPYLLFRILWPTESDFRVRRPEVPLGRTAAIRGRLIRLGRGILQLPALARATRDNNLELDNYSYPSSPSQQE